ncbi:MULTISPECIES: lyase family protein [Paenibacillus]|uniref:lyase family protein n=1 Tax=Paenibacillus TaxID=44249 RepID=UPI001BCF2CAD|nr:lyase family protein [Paenibacillus lactis]
MMIRIERDKTGPVEVPSHAYYGVQTMRAAGQYPKVNAPVHGQFIKALACVKSAAVRAGIDQEIVPGRIGNLIMKAADEIKEGKHSEQFIAGYIHGSSSHLLNVNLNEVLANRALELMLEDKGNYDLIDPDLHVNGPHSADWILSTSLNVAAHQLTHKLVSATEGLKYRLWMAKERLEGQRQGNSTDPVMNVPARLTRTFGESAKQLQLDAARLAEAASRFKRIRIDSARDAVMPQANRELTERTVSYLRHMTRIEFFAASRWDASSGSKSVYADLSSVLKTLAVNLFKLCSDIRNAASLKGSATSPESRRFLESAGFLHQICVLVIGYDHIISLAEEAGIPDEETVPPVIFYHVLESLDIMMKGIDSFAGSLTQEQDDADPAGIRR